MAAMLLSQSFESPAAWKERSFRRSVVGVSSSVSASWFKLRIVLVGENSSSSNVRTVEAGETASILGASAWMRCASARALFWAPGLAGGAGLRTAQAAGLLGAPWNGQICVG